VNVKQPASPGCICAAFHLDYSQEEIDRGDLGHCLCACHGPGEHVDGAPCPCNTEQVS